MRLKKTLAVVAVMTVAASMAAPAALAKGKGSGGKKAIGEVTTFDATSGALVVTLADGTVFAGTANEDTKVKVEHRGSRKGTKKPSNGSLSDLAAGAKVLKLKTADDGLTVEKIRLRPVATAPVAEEPADEDGTGDETETGEDPAEEPGEEEPADDGDEDGSEDDGDEVLPCDPLTDLTGCITP